MEKNKSRWRVFWVVLVVFAVIALIILGYEASWTGFRWAKYPKYTNYDFVPSKTLWDWLNLLIVPTVLAVAAFLFNRAEKASEREKTLDQQREVALQSYLTNMTELLLDKGLASDNANEKITSIARARTLTVLKTLDGERKRQVFQFLLEAHLITDRNTEDAKSRSTPILRLDGADLSNAKLVGLYLKGVVFYETVLSGADFSHTNLKDVRFLDSKLDEKWNRVWELSNHNYYGVNKDFRKADFSNSYLENIDFGKSDLRGADFTGANLQRTKFNHAIIDKTTKLPKKFILARKIFLESGKYSEKNRPDFRSHDLSEVSLVSVTLPSPTFDNANLEYTDLSYSTINGASFLNAHINRSLFFKASIQKSNFEKVNFFLADFTESNLRGSCFRYSSASHTKFTRAKLDGIDFEHANLRSSKFEDATFYRADLSHTNLKSAELTGTNLRETNLSYSDLTDANLSGADLTNADLKFSILRNTTLDGLTELNDKWRLIRNLMTDGVRNTTVSGQDYSNANLTESIFENATLKNINFENSNLQKATFKNCRLINCNFRNTDLQESDFSGAEMKGCNFDFAKLDKIICDTSTVWDKGNAIGNKWGVLWSIIVGVVRMHETPLDLSGSNFSSAYLVDAFLQNTIMDNVDFRNSVLSKADFRGSSLQFADFEDAELSGANFAGADLRGANFKNVNLGGVRYLHSMIDETTQLDDKWRRVWNLANSAEDKKVFDNEDLSDVCFENFEMMFASFKNTNLCGAQFILSKVSGANFQGADLSKSTISTSVFIMSDFRNAVFDGANIWWSSFKRSNLTTWQLKNAERVVDTVLPSGKKFTKNKETL